MKQRDNSPEPALGEESIQKELERLVTADAFSRALKLREFLVYVVTKSLAGESSRINATSIAQAVYQRGPRFDAQNDPIVRVEAGRLRSRLKEYYASEGANDAVVIDIPKGGYVPTFEARLKSRQNPGPTPAQEQSPRGVILWMAAGFGAALGIAVLWYSLAERPVPATSKTDYTENTEAYALFHQALLIARPPHVLARVEAALELAKQAVVEDPSFSGGYAAESFLTWQYVVFGHSATPDEDTKRAVVLARKAVEVDPEFGWGYHSLSRALQLSGDLEGGVSAARDAVDIAPGNAEFQGNFGLALITAGRYSDAIKPIQEAIRLAGENVRVPYLNYLGIALFHSGDYEHAAKIIQQNRARGGPNGPHMLAYLAASYAASGNMGKARAAAELVRADTTGFPVAAFIDYVISDARAREAVFQALKVAGLDSVRN